MDALELAEKAMKQNIINMAVGFTAMMPLFQERSTDLIKRKLTDFFEALDCISTDQDFGKRHSDFCQWFVKTIVLADTPEPPSYCQAAEVLDLALKVYVYYCKMPSLEKARSLMPMLNGAIDTPILRHLFKRVEGSYGKPYPPHHLWTIKMVDKEGYDFLQKVIRQEIRDSFEDDLLPVQYDDVIKLNSDR
ncbi:MAG: hypothetical protein PVG49_07070 [Desulfobacteraceae bacterium]|jgi:hypothetical protein